jgi:hypothetical protein
MDFKTYYENQVGSGLPVFYGAKFQRGHGLGSMFKRFYRWVSPIFKTHALPVLKKGAEAVGTEALKTAANIANDTLAGKEFELAAKERAEEAIQNLSKRALQSGSGRVYKRKKNFKHLFQRPTKIRKTRDIFDH